MIILFHVYNVCVYVYVYIYIYIYNDYIHQVSVTRFPSFRTQPLENLSVDSVNNGFLSNPAPGEKSWPLSGPHRPTPPPPFICIKHMPL